MMGLAAVKPHAVRFPSRVIVSHVYHNALAAASMLDVSTDGKMQAEATVEQPDNVVLHEQCEHACALAEAKGTIKGAIVLNKRVQMAEPLQDLL